MDAQNSPLRPADWPGNGPIDLSRHDLPHSSSMTEWWYANAHLETADGRQLSVFAAFFRIVKGRDEATLETQYAHSLSWSLSDLNAKRFYHDTIVDRDAPRLGLERLDRAEEQGIKGATKDRRVRRAAREILERGQVPYPDHMFKEEPFCNTRKLELDFDGNRFEKLDDGSYKLNLWHEYFEVGVDLIFKPECQPIRHGIDGVVHGHDGADMFYYFLPQMSVEGSVTMNATKVPVVAGRGWYDHEFGGQRQEGQDELDSIAWNWMGVQLDTGAAFSCYTLVDTEADAAGAKPLGQRLVFISKEGERSDFGDVIMTPLASWRSTRTFNSYPVRWRVVSEEAGLDCEVVASIDDQEVVTLISKPAFWEGRVDLKGTLKGQPFTGRGYLERSGHLDIDDLEGFFKAVGKEVRKSVANLLPFEPTFEQVRDLIASEKREHYMDGVDLKQFVKTGVVPVREITDRGGKGWRSYAALACCDVVGGDSREYVHWLAMPELMHVGSLIVDDVQDRSTVRRGGPACHVTHGDALAINAGTSCYFMGQSLLHSTKVSNANKLELYNLYFEALRAGHAGQAADIEGLWSYVPKAVETGDVSELESRVLAIHRLKTAAPAGALARMGALIGNGTAEQVEGLGRYFESLGLAFQMVDDVLNLRGFKGDLKARGEDLAHGKITLPVVRALPKLDRAAREALVAQIESKTSDQSIIDGMIDLIEASGGLEETSQAAHDLVEAAWKAVDPLLEPSIVKIMLRSFGGFVLERHY